MIYCLYVKYVRNSMISTNRINVERVFNNSINNINCFPIKQLFRMLQFTVFFLSI